MGRSLRKRSGSGNSYKEMIKPAVGGHGKDSLHSDAVDQVRQWMKLLLSSRQGLGRSQILHQPGNFALLAAYLTRTRQLDHHHANGCTQSQKQLLLESDAESSYTALHRALLRGDLATTLLLLQHASTAECMEDDNGGDARQRRLKHRPMALLEYHEASGKAQAQPPAPLWQTIVTAKDAQGYTPGQLLASLQQAELDACRAILPRPRILTSTQRGRDRQGSFDAEEEEEEGEAGFEVLRVLMQPDQQSDEDESSAGRGNVGSSANGVTYGCEVLTFGRAHHCALGVGADATTRTTSDYAIGSPQKNTESAVRPHRVPAFAQSEVGRSHGAVAVAAATYHTMVLNRAGQVFTFGLGKGGRLGTGSERHSPVPQQVQLGKLFVTSIAAAENHSLAVTSCGQVWAWGSNRFGQLGSTSASENSTTSGQGSSCVLLPRPVDDEIMKVPIRSVAAGERHSVALSSSGHVYVWGDNSSGQLGLPPSSSPRHGRVQRVLGVLEGRTAVAVAASAFATMVLTLPPQDALPVNAIYSWGHGNYVPTKVHLSGRPRSNSSGDIPENNRSRQGSTLVSPVAIACAKHHNVAITQNGLVYTWGFHAESLGNGRGSNKSYKKRTSEAATPQLVEGMLPENNGGGGLAVAVSASENHTAVLTNTGALYTWGATHGPDILGHQGVRFQPNPKKVPGVYRGVAVAAAKEHMCVLMGASFPATPVLDRHASSSSLEHLAARRVTEFVDLFNVLPILVTAERAQNELLTRFCLEFCERNLDGVLNVGQRSVMNTYLTEQLQTHTVANRFSFLDDFDKLEARDAHCHPILKDFVAAGCGQQRERKESADLRPHYPTDLSNFAEWIASGKELMQSPSAQVFLQQLDQQRQQAIFHRMRPIKRARAVSFGQEEVLVVSKCSLRCQELVTKADNVAGGDLGSIDEVQQSLMKETRAIRKRLGQISKLESQSQSGSVLSTEQREKLGRKSQLETDLEKLEPALKAVEELMQKDSPAKSPEPTTESLSQPVDDARKSADDDTRRNFTCSICGITCSDKSSYSLHMNGRKHRNRVVQMEQSEREHKAAMVAEEHRKESLKKSFRGGSEAPVAKATKGSPWKLGPNSPVAPVYKLPPPPHGVPSMLSSPPSSPAKPRSLRDIMADETDKSVAGKKAASAKKIAPGPLQLHVQALPKLESPPWNTPAARVDIAAPTSDQRDNTNKTVTLVDFTTVPRKRTGSVVGGAPPPQTNAPKGWAVPMTPRASVGDKSHSSPAATKGVPTRNAPPPMPSPPSGRAPVALVDFIAAGSKSSSVADFTAPHKNSSCQKAWSTEPKASSHAMPSATSTTCKVSSFADIQDEALAFRAKQDPSSGEQGKWFVADRERAGSLKEIQKTAEKEREDRLFVEEQFRIEKMILEDIEKKRKEEERKAAASKKKKRHRNAKKPNNSSKGQAEKPLDNAKSPRQGQNTRGNRARKGPKPSKQQQPDSSAEPTTPAEETARRASNGAPGVG